MAITLNNTSITSSSGVVDIDGTGALQLPQGTTAQRPSAVIGQIRYNTDLNFVEVYQEDTWNVLGNVINIEYRNSQNNGRIAYTGGAGTRYDQSSCPAGYVAQSDDTYLLWIANFTGTVDSTHMGLRTQYNVNGGGFSDCQPGYGGGGAGTMPWQSNQNNASTASVVGYVPNSAYSRGDTIGFQVAVYSPQNYFLVFGGSGSNWLGLTYSRGNHWLMEILT
jgi:hypothetical protein